MAKTTRAEYENNPFYIGLNGLKLFFQNAQSVAIYTIIITVLFSLIGFIVSVAGNALDDSTTNGPLSPSQSSDWGLNGATTPQILLGGLVLFGIVAAFCFVFLSVSLLLYGVGDYAAAQLALGKKTDLGTAFKAVISRFPSYVWVYIILIVKVLLWSLLFIVPGVIMAYRYMLAGTVFFAEGKRGNAAVKRSAELTKGAWLTNYAGFSLWNIITQGLMTMVLIPGSFALLYRQFREVTDSNEPKPAAHWLSWLTLLAPIAIVVLVVGLVAMLGLLIWLAHHSAS